MWNPAPSNALAVGCSAYPTPFLRHHELQALLHTTAEPLVATYVPFREGRDSVRMPLRSEARQNRILDALPEAEARDGETGKLAKYFSEVAGEGN